MPKAERKKERAIKELFPELTDEERKEAEENLKRYLEVTLRIYDRITNDPAEYAKLVTLLRKRRKQKRKNEKRRSLAYYQMRSDNVAVKG